MIKFLYLLGTAAIVLVGGIACAAEPTAEPTRRRRSTAVVVITLTPVQLAATATPPWTASVTPRPRATSTPTFTHTPVPPTPTRVPATVTPTATWTPNPPFTPVVWDPRLDDLNIQYVSAQVEPGEMYWRLTHAEFWSEAENQGKNHIFVNVLDESGARLIGETITIEWLDGQHVITTEEKPAPEFSANFPMDINHYPPWHTLGAYSARVNGLPSDLVKGMGRPPPKSRPVVYLLTFQRTIR